MPATEQTIISRRLHDLFLTANNVLVLTGAGVSAESGVPTFRGGGQSAVWRGMPFEVISSAQMLVRDLPAVWEWLNSGKLRQQPISVCVLGLLVAVLLSELSHFHFGAAYEAVAAHHPTKDRASPAICPMHRLGFTG